MADIFISYARTDKARVAPLVAALEAQGFSIWWDPAIAPGQEFDSLIRRELNAARAVIVVWTPTSVESRWVRGEARIGADRGVLVPVRFDAAQLPIDALSLHTTDLDHWGQSPESAAFKDLIRALKLYCSPASDRGQITGAHRGDAVVSIAVLPFVNMSADPEQEYFSDGLSEELINRLAKHSNLRVAGRTSSFAFKGKDDDLRLIGNKLGVTHVLEGSVRKAGQRLRITAQLIKCRDGFHLWSETYDRQLDDVFAVQDEVAGAVAKALGIKLGLAEAARFPTATTSFEAYDKYLRAMTLRTGDSPTELRGAVDLFRETLALDPNFMPARAGLVATYALLLTFVPESFAQISEQLAEEVNNVLAHAPDHWAGHLAGGILALQRHEWLAADAALARAYALAPPSEDLASLCYSLVLSAVGRNCEAVRVLVAARATHPLLPPLTAMIQQNLDIVGRPSDAQAEYERTKDLPGFREIPEHHALLRLWPTGDLATIRTQAQRFFGSQVVPMPVLRKVYDLFDQPPAALDALRQAFDDPAYQDATRLTILSLYAAHFGDTALALSALRRAFIDKHASILHVLWYPEFFEARRTRGFQELIRELKLYEYWRDSGKWSDFVRPKGLNDFEVIR